MTNTHKSSIIKVQKNKKRNRAKEEGEKTLCAAEGADNMTKKTFEQWFNETQDPKYECYYPFENYVKIFKNFKWAKNITADKLELNPNTMFMHVKSDDEKTMKKIIHTDSDDLGLLADFVEDEKKEKDEKIQEVRERASREKEGVVEYFNERIRDLRKSLEKALEKINQERNEAIEKINQEHKKC